MQLKFLSQLELAKKITIWVISIRIFFMKTVLNFISFICVCVATFFLCAMDMEGCNTTDDRDMEEDPVAFREVVPPSGSQIDPNATIIVSFDAPPTDLSVSSGIISVSGAEVKINGPFSPGPLNLMLTWSDGTTSLTYTVKLPALGEEITSSGDGRTMVLVSAGEFQMGSDTADPEDWLVGAPAHTVHVDAFYMDTHEVTNADYFKFLLENPKWEKNNIREELHDGFYLADWNGNSYPIWKANHPVTNVNWYAAMAYAEWAGKRLPTEAEWEKAARGGLVGKMYPWGDAAIDKFRANFNHRIGDTSPVGSYAPNGYGLYDMTGNVWEWCLDEAISDFYGNSPFKNPLAGVSGNTLSNLHELTSDFTNVQTVRILRGGSYYSSAESSRVTTRGGKLPKWSLGSAGFRCVKTVTP